MQESQERRLIRLLMATCQQVGGELRIDKDIFESVNEGVELFCRDDVKNNQMVVTVSRGGAFYKIAPQPKLQPSGAFQPAPPIQQTSRRLTDEDLAAMENKQAQEAALRRARG